MAAETQMQNNEGWKLSRMNQIIITPSANKKDKTQQNSKCRLCGDRDEKIDHIINQ